jgi:hypothetical protein
MSSSFLVIIYYVRKRRVKYKNSDLTSVGHPVFPYAGGEKGCKCHDGN